MNIANFRKFVGGFLLVLLVTGSSAVLAQAQSDRTRSDTGRHRLKPAPEPKTDENLVPHEDVLAGPRWFVGVGGGFLGGGDLWRVETVTPEPTTQPWISAVPFRSSRFNATLDNNFGTSLFVGRHMGSMWSLRADLNSARMDVAAEAQQTQGAAVFLYDRLTITTLGLALEVRLARFSSYPYANIGVVLNSINAARESELDQDQVGVRLGLGYLKALNPQFSLRAEARFSRSSFEAGEFVPQAALFTQPEVEFEPTDDLNLFEVLLAVQLNFGGVRR